MIANEINLSNLILSMEKNASILNSIESYDNLETCDSSNVSTVTINETLSRLCWKHYSALEYIRSFKGEACYEKTNYEPSFSSSILIWYKFSFEQRGRNVLVKNHSDGSQYLASSMTNAKEYIRYNFK